MKALVGIDATGTYQPALNLLKRLEFPEATTTLVHVSDLGLLLEDSEFFNAEMSAEYARIAYDQGYVALKRAMSLASARDLHPNTKLLHGRPAGMLLAEADSELSDIVAVCTEHYGA